MKIINTTLALPLTLALASSLVACSDDKNESGVSDSKRPVSEVVVTKVTDSSFKKMLTHIPADTAYLVTNKKSIPDDVLESHLARSKQMMQMWLDLLENAKETSETKAQDSGQLSLGENQAENNTEGGVDKAVTQTTEKSTTERSTAAVQEDDKSGDFFIALLKDFMGNMSVDKIANTGIKVDGHSALYGVDLAPVIRYDITSKDAVMDTLKRAEKESGYNVEWKKCGEFDCIEKNGKENGFVIVILKNQVVAGLFTAENKTVVMDHLTGKSKPYASYVASNWDQFLSDNKYAGYGDGYVNLKKVYSTFEKLLLEEEKKKAGSRAEGEASTKQEAAAFDEKTWKACSTVVNRHIEHVPEAVFGIKTLEQRLMDYEIVLKTSPEVSSMVAAIANPLTGMQQAKNPVFDLGLNLNFGKLREGLSQYTNFLVKNAEELQCEAIKPAEVRKAMGGFTMATMMGVNQFKAIYVSVNDLKMGADGKPEKMDLYASVFADQPAALLQILAMVNPAFATLKLPADGTATKLPEGLLPPNPTGVNPEIYVSQKDQLLNIMVGDTKPELKPLKTDNPPFFWNTVDSKRYYEIIGNVMENTQSVKGVKTANDEKTKEAIQVLTKMSEVSGLVHTQMGADSRGVTINYSIEYDK